METVLNGAWPLFWASIGIAVSKLTEKLLNRGNEVRTEIEGLRNEVRLVNVELRHWKGQFYLLLDATIRNDKKTLHELLEAHSGVEKES